MIENLSDHNRDEIQKFINKNIEKSLFIESNFNRKDSKIVCVKHNSKIVGMFLIYLDTYITYLFSEKASPKDKEQLINYATKLNHLKGTVVVNYEEELIFLSKNYKIDALNKLAIKANYNEKSLNNLNIIMLTKENSDLYIDAYLENINNIFNASYEKSFIKNVIEKENVFVLLENQKIIGGVTVNTSEKNLTAVITTVFICPEFQNQKYCTKMLNQVFSLNEFKDKILTIFFDSEIAEKTYLSLGFKINKQVIMFSKK